jgi:glycosyltransferase involved in cell wall biosynthesis
MKILIVSQYYLPTRVAASVRISRMARVLSQDHQVTVLTGPTSDQNKNLLDTSNKIKIVRVSSHLARQSSLSRIWAQISFMFCSFWKALWLEKPDLIIATSPPLFVGFSAAMIGFCRNIPLIVDIRDLWPESMIVLRFIRNRIIIGLLITMANFIYRRAKIITVVTPQIQTDLQKKLPQKPIFLLSNATDTDYFKPLKIDKKKFGYNEKDIIVTYVGIFSPAQALDQVIQTAKILSREAKIKFLFVGQGDDESRLLKLAKNLKNVTFLPYQPQVEVLKIINMSDICLITLAKNQLFTGAIPSKTFEYLACAKAVIAAAQGDIEKVVIQNQTGLVVPPENPTMLAKAISRLAQEPALRQKIGSTGRLHIQKNYSENVFAINLRELLKNIN